MLLIVDLCDADFVVFVFECVWILRALCFGSFVCLVFVRF